MTRKKALFFLIIFSSYLFLFGLGNMALTDPDEPFYAQSAKEMLEKGDWLTPHIFGEPQFEKPPLYYWLIVVSYKFFGVNEFAARFPSALCGILGVIGIYFLGLLLFSERTAFFSAIVMATSVEYIILARGCITDMLLCVTILYGFVFYLFGYFNGHWKRFYLAAAFFIGLAVLTKGPVGFILPAFIIFLYLVLKRDIKAVLRFPFISAGLIFIATACPWYYLMYKVHGAVFMDSFFGFQNVTRFLSPEHKIGDVPYYYLPVVLGGFFPWSVLMPYALYKAFKSGRPMSGKYLFLIIWTAVFFVFFSVSRTKLPTYIFPLFPALAVFTGRFMDTVYDEKFSVAEKLSGWILALALPAGIAVSYFYVLKKYPDMAEALLKTGILLFIGAAMVVISLVKGRKKVFFSSVVVTMSLCVLALVLFLSYPIGLYESSKYFVSELKGHMKPGEKVGAEADHMRGAAFYLGTTDILDVHKHDKLTKFLKRNERVWVIIKDKNHRELYTDRKAPYDRVSYVVYRYGKRVIVTNILPDDGKYLKMRTPDDPT